MFMLNNRPLPIDVPFTVGEGDDLVRYPANWLRLSTPEEKAAIGITEVIDAPSFDSRYYWSYGVPKPLDDAQITPEGGEPYIQRGLKSIAIEQIKETAGYLLAPTSWMIERSVDPSSGKPVPQNVLDYRAAVRAASDANEAAVLACTTVDQLASLQQVWPEA